MPLPQTPVPTPVEVQACQAYASAIDRSTVILWAMTDVLQHHFTVGNTAGEP